MSKIFRRSEYEQSMNLARKARRRGDVVSAERWLKHADRQLGAEDRLRESIAKAKRRELDLAAGDVRERQRRDEEERAHVIREIEDELDRIDAMRDEEEEETSEKSGMDLPPSNAR